MTTISRRPGWTLALKGRCDIFLFTTAAMGLCLGMLVQVEANDVPLPPRKSLDENPQIDLDDYNKRDWKTDLHMWGKRGWSNLHPGWGKRDYTSEEDTDVGSQAMDKRAWQKLQAGWGKRFTPSENDLMLRDLAAALDEEALDNNQVEQEFDSHEMDKRDWRSFNEGWGKRSNKWDKFRGSWGKRQPAWNNLKGLWGKRSVVE